MASVALMIAVTASPVSSPRRSSLWYIERSRTFSHVVPV